MPRLIVLGTGTGIGKTYVACALARALAEASPDIRISAFKPLESGIRPSLVGRVPDDSDAALLGRASKPAFVPPTPPYWLSTPVSPHLAARIEGKTIELSVVCRWCDDVAGDVNHTIRCVQPHDDTSVVTSRRAPIDLFETAGATFSPVTENQTNFDLAVSLGPASWVLVAPDRLGVLHDVATTLECMRARGRAPDFLVLSRPDPRDTSVGTNQAELERLGIAHVHAVVPFQGTVDLAAARAIAAHLFSTQTP
jgi:dethiobiotin synthetase